MTTTETTPAEEFETMTPAEVRKLTTTARTKEIDSIWAGRIQTLGIGQGFKTSRPETETVRQFKKRINGAAGSVFRTLVWTTLDPKQPEGVEPSKFLAKVSAIDTKAETEAKNAVASESSQNGTVANETPETPDSTSQTEEPAQPRVRGR